MNKEQSGSYEQLALEEQNDMNLFMKILRIYEWASGFRFKDQLTSSKFTKLASLQKTGVFLQKVEFELLFSKLTKVNSNFMDFQDFINAIEIIAEKKFPALGSKKEKVMALIADFLSVINLKK
eukprot:TRINITY_DN43060_c0_g1_i1.p3 TRINITY_DN43060_c0_g1~~TRINITY_DN43060_c0_g1_i1.p3  ORF type:complete len:123 (+),score=30.19 TRINITY_DN43060_c0_g1_i1:605-973(+)